MKKLIALLSLVFIVTACSSDDSVVESSNILLRKLIQTSGDNTDTTIYTYNGNKLVSAMRNDDTLITYSYSADLLTSINIFFNNNSTHIFTNTFDSSGRIMSATNVSIGANQGFRSVYTHNDDNTISVARFYGDAESQDNVDLPGKYFLNADGEIQKFERYASSGTITNTYTYDSKNNPYKNIVGFNKLLNITGSNFNVTSVTTTDADNIVVGGNAIEYSYNAQSFPTSSVNDNGGSGSTFTSQYFYE